MKEKLLDSFKKVKQKSNLVNTAIIMILFTTFISLSIRSSGLFLKEILLCGIIIGIVLLNSNLKKIQ